MKSFLKSVLLSTRSVRHSWLALCGKRPGAFSFFFFWFVVVLEGGEIICPAAAAGRLRLALRRTRSWLSAAALTPGAQSQPRWHSDLPRTGSKWLLAPSL